MPMDVSVREEAAGTVVSLGGRLDIVSCEDVGRRLEDLIAAGHRHLVLDAAGMTYVSSAGLKAILHAYKGLKARQGTIRVAGATEFVTQVMRTTGFSTLVPLFATLDEALASPVG